MARKTRSAKESRNALSAKHEIHTIEVNKTALNRDDDKRISRKDGISTFARGHKDLSWSPLLGELSLI